MAGSLEGNKVIAAVLTAGIIATAAGNFSRIFYEPEMLAQDAYKIAVPEKPAGGGGAPVPGGSEPVTPIAPLLASASADEGQAITKKCQSCHNFEKDGANKVGPDLWGVVNRDVGKHEGFQYSSAMSAKGGQWTYEELNNFLANPRGYVSGTKMSFAGLPKEKDRADVIAYLRTLADSPVPLPQGG